MYRNKIHFHCRHHLQPKFILQENVNAVLAEVNPPISLNAGVMKSHMTTPRTGSPVARSMLAVTAWQLFPPCEMEARISLKKWWKQLPRLACLSFCWLLTDPISICTVGYLIVKDTSIYTLYKYISHMLSQLSSPETSQAFSKQHWWMCVPSSMLMKLRLLKTCMSHPKTQSFAKWWKDKSPLITCWDQFLIPKPIVWRYSFLWGMSSKIIQSPSAGRTSLFPNLIGNQLMQ